jgi:hypothetical protein
MGLRLHALEHLRDFSKPPAVSLVVLGARTATDVRPQCAVAADRSNWTGEREAAICQGDQSPRSVGTLGEQAVYGDPKNTLRAARVAVIGVPPAHGKGGPAVHVARFSRTA